MITRSRRRGLETWELVARESCRDTIARYTHAGDRLLLAELSGAFCEDGTLEIRGTEPARGRQAIIERLGGGRGRTADAIRTRASAEHATETPKRIVRHNVSNIRFEAVAPDEVHISSYFSVYTEKGLDHFGRYRDRLVPVEDQWLIAHRFVSVDWYAPDSSFREAARTGA
jgi:hypothetical protein